MSFQFIPTFDESFVLLAEHRYLQKLSGISITSFCRCYLKAHTVKVKVQGILNRHITF